MSVLVIGGEGFVGSHVVREFIKRGHEVTVFGWKVQENLLKDVEDQYTFIEGDLIDLSAVFKALKTSNAKYVIHLAAFGAGSAGLARSAQESPKKALEVNVNGFFHLLQACEVMGVKRVIWSSSSTVFGWAHHYEEPVKEYVPLIPSLFYGSTKVMKEQIGTYFHHQSNMEVSGLRLPLLFGPGRWYKGAGGALVDLFEKSERGKNLKLKSGSEKLDLMYAKDIGPLFYKVTFHEGSISPIYNVTSFRTTIMDMAKKVGELLGAKIEVEIEEKDTIYPLMDFSLMDREIGFEITYDANLACEDYLRELNKI